MLCSKGYLLLEGNKLFEPFEPLKLIESYFVASCFSMEISTFPPILF